MVVQVYVQRIVESGCRGQLKRCSRRTYTSGWRARSVLALGLQLWLLAGMGCQGYGCGLCAAGLERLMISAWSVGFSVESRLHADTRVSAWRLPKKWQRGASIPSQFQRGISRLVKKQSVRVSAWSRAQFQRGGKFQRGNAFSMLILSISVGTESTIVFS